MQELWYRPIVLLIVLAGAYFAVRTNRAQITAISTARTAASREYTMLTRYGLIASALVNSFW